MRAMIPMLAVCLLTLPAAAQTTKPSADLQRENQELRAYVDKLEARIAELEAKLKAQTKPAPRAQAAPFKPAPYGYQLPAPPFHVPPPSVPAPTPNLRMPAPGERIPDSWQRHQFNGQEFYLVPLK